MHESLDLKSKVEKRDPTHVAMSEMDGYSQNMQDGLQEDGVVWACATDRVGALCIPRGWKERWTLWEAHLSLCERWLDREAGYVQGHLRMHSHLCISLYRATNKHIVGEERGT